MCVCVHAHPHPHTTHLSTYHMASGDVNGVPQLENTLIVFNKGKGNTVA